MEFDVLTLSRLQFAFTVMFHYIFPPLSIGLGALMVIVEAMYLRTGDPHYEAMARFWTKVFAVNFGMGVATGIVMEFEFGTNWAAYSRYVGDVFGSALAAEGIFAFFLESGFLAILVFGWDRVGKKMHFFSTLMVFLGSVFSSVWIVVANSWMQTPAGFEVVGEGMEARAEIVDFWAMALNPSSIERLLHVWTGSFILGSFFALSVASYYLLRGVHVGFAQRTMKLALSMALVSSFGALFTGHLSAELIAEYQPAKLAAFEGHFETGPGDLYLFGVPDPEARSVSGIAVPNGLSMLVHMDPDAPVIGLDQFPEEDWPNVGLVFQTYHLMIGLGMLFIALSVCGVFFWWRGTLFEQRWLLKIYVFAVLGAYVANQAGWVSAEAGRQPWIVYNLLRTSDALSENVTREMVLTSILMFGAIYALLFFVWVFVMNEKIQKGPAPPRVEAPARAAAVTGGQAVLDAAALRTDASGPRMSEERSEEEAD